LEVRGGTHRAFRACRARAAIHDCGVDIFILQLNTLQVMKNWERPGTRLGYEMQGH